MADRLLIAWSLIALLVLSGCAAVWLAATNRRQQLRREHRAEKRRESDIAPRGTLRSD